LQRIHAAHTTLQRDAMLQHRTQGQAAGVSAVATCVHSDKAPVGVQGLASRDIMDLAVASDYSWLTAHS
jgi:hypothetical protein